MSAGAQRSAAVVVVGGGLAGTSAAIELSRAGLSTCVLERTDYARWRPGETLSPLAHAELGRFLSPEQLAGAGTLPSHGIEAAWGADRPRFHSFLTNPYGSGWHVDRRRLDERMSRLAEERGVEVLRRTTVLHAARDAGGWRLQAGAPGGVLEVRCDAVVDATGRSARVARRCGVRRTRVDALCSVSALFDMPEGQERTLRVEAIPLGWWYLAPLPGNRAIVSLLSDADLLARRRAFSPAGWMELLAEAKHLRRALGPRPEPGPPGLQVRPCETSSLERAGGDGWIAVGDAASVLDPLSSGGIVKALRSGRKAAAAVRAALGGDGAAIARYADEQAAAFARYLDARRDHYATERRWSGEEFWRRRQQRAAA